VTLAFRRNVANEYGHQPRTIGDRGAEFSQASVREVGGAPLDASDMSAAATALATELSAAGVAPHEAVVSYFQRAAGSGRLPGSMAC